MIGVDGGFVARVGGIGDRAASNGGWVVATRVADAVGGSVSGESEVACSSGQGGWGIRSFRTAGVGGSDTCTDRGAW